MTPAELQTQLTEFLALPAETEWVEFKEAKNNCDFDDLGQYFSALWSSAPKGQPYVSPGHRPGEVIAKVIQPRRGDTKLDSQDAFNQPWRTLFRAAPLGLSWVVVTVPRPLAWADMGLPLGGERQELRREGTIQKIGSSTGPMARWRLSKPAAEAKN